MEVIHLPENEIRKILTQDMIQRRNLHWNLITFDQAFETIKPFREFKTKRSEAIVSLRGSKISKFNKLAGCVSLLAEYKSKESIVILTMIEKYKHCMCIAGGSILSRLKGEPVGFQANPDDIDIFFYGISEEVATKIITECVVYLATNMDKVDFKPRWNGDDQNPNSKNFRVYVKRNQHTTTVCTEYMDEGKCYTIMGIDIQFIHRIYPRKDMIIGGFDLGCCSYMYDGEELLTTPLGAWCLVNNAFPIDISRRSTSFEHRIIKYTRKYGFTPLFPGLDPTLNYKFDKNCTEDDMKFLNKILAKHHFRLNYNDDGNVTRDIIRIEPPYVKNLYIHEYGIDTLRTKIHNGCSEDYIKRRSDYSYMKTQSSRLESCNLTAIVCENYDAVYSITRFWNYNPDKENKDRIFFKSFDVPVQGFAASTCLKLFESNLASPNIGWESLPEIYKQRLVYYLENWENVHHHFRQNAIKLFGKEYVQILDNIKCYKAEKVPELIEQLELNLLTRMQVSVEKFKHPRNLIKFITENPHRQWTSSFNPIVTKPTDWYNEQFYKSFKIGLPEEIEMILRCIRNRDKKFRLSTLNYLNNDLFKIVLNKLTYAWYVKPEFKLSKATPAQLALLEQNCPKDLKQLIQNLF